MWFRNDLRLDDNPALHAAVSSGRPLVCLYVLDEDSDGLRLPGGASKWWLDKSLRALASDIAERGGQLTLRRGAAAGVIEDVVDKTGAQSVVWNRRYDEGGRETDAAIKETLRKRGLRADSFNGSLLNEPWCFETSTGGYYKVFTPYWKTVWKTYEATRTLGTPSSLEGPEVSGDHLDDWALHPTRPDWSGGLEETWSPGEAGARARLDSFLDGPACDYDTHRDRPDLDGTSRLSPHLRFGEISPAAVWRSVREAMRAGEIPEGDAMSYLSELVWREFSYVLLFHNPQLADENYNSDFRHMPWRDSDADLGAWQRGRTGYPMVDAGMRQLWATGWMHNRVRMITGSFLTKHLLLPWQKGEDWFWDTLVDADPASNAAGWQWVAGSGADAAPYFRVFNPITQGEKFDATGAYVRHWCPELKDLPDKHLHAPWKAPKSVLEEAGIELGKDYPLPVIEHMDGRQRALDAYDTLKERRETA